MTTNVPNFSPRDFGRAAKDYATHRKGFPESFFERLLREGIGRPGQRVLDLGTGTGTLARGFAAGGALATGLDITPELLEQARALGERDGVRVEYIVSKAESIPLPDRSFDVITAGHCWHWFDGIMAARESYRLLEPGGRLLIAHFSYLPDKDTVGSATEELILRYNPEWPLAGHNGKYEKWGEPMEHVGFRDIRSYFYDESVPYSHEEWRGRIRACNGVLALQASSKIEAFDKELENLLKKRFPDEPLKIPHRIFVIVGSKP